MTSRPVVIFGAAFVVTALAALFAPILLLFIALPSAFCLLFLRGRARRAAVAAAVGCLTACVASGLFFLRLDSSRGLVGSVQTVTGSVFYRDGRQMVQLSLPDSSSPVALLFPPEEGLETGDGIAGTVTVTAADADGGAGLQSGGVLLTCEPLELRLCPDLAPPLWVRGMQLREQLCYRLRALSPIPATDVTVAVLLSVKDYLTPPLREAFSDSGMAHLLSVSGLHLSILVWTLVGVVVRLGGGRVSQAIVGSSAALVVFFTAGMTPSVFRATLMILLTLFAGLVSRKSDGLTSLSVAAVLLAAASPPILTDLSFLLSFLSVSGILLLAPRFSAALEQLWISRFSRCGKGMRQLMGAVSVSAAAQLATAPLVAVTFGTLPLLGIAVNLVAIPFVYPLLVFGFAACICLLLFPAGVPLLLLPANLCSAVLAFIARIAAGLPFCTLRVVFPADLLPLLFPTLALLTAAVFPYRVRLLRRVAVWCAALTLLSGAANAFISYNSVTVASSAVTGSLIVASRDGVVLLDNTQRDYHRTLDSRLLERLGQGAPDILAATYPYDTQSRRDAAAGRYPTASLCTPGELSRPFPALPGIEVTLPHPYVTEIAIGNTKVMKFYATYDRIEGINIPEGDILLADRQGNLLSPGGRRYIFRRGNGESYTRIYRDLWR